SDVQTKIDLLLKEDKEWDEDLSKRRYAALADLKKLQGPDKAQINDYILTWLGAATRNQWQRAWAISALAQLGCADGNEYVEKHMLEQDETHAWTRHFALVNGANLDPFPMDRITMAATHDRDVLPRATALRLLIARGFSEYEKNIQEMLQNQQDPSERWAAAR